MEILLNGSTGAYNLDVHGPLKGRYVGTFVFRAYLTPLEYVACDREYRDLIGKIQTQVDPLADFLAFALVQLKYRIVSAPAFWFDKEVMGGGSVPDRIVLETLLEASSAVERKYKEDILEKHSEAIDKIKEQLDKDKKALYVEKELGAPAEPKK